MQKSLEQPMEQRSSYELPSLGDGFSWVHYALRLPLSSRLLSAVHLGLMFVVAAPAIAQSPATQLTQSSSTPSADVASNAAPADLPVDVESAAASAPTSTEISRSSTAAPLESRVVLSLQDRRVYLYRGDMLVSSYPVAIGTDETPTPQGQFVVQQMVVNPVWQSPWTGEVHEPGPNSALGLRWIEFATSDAGAFGFHGTPTLESIGKAASNGCVRMRNEDVVALYDQVSVGTVVVVEP